MERVIEEWDKAVFRVERGGRSIDRIHLYRVDAEPFRQLQALFHRIHRKHLARAAALRDLIYRQAGK